METEDRKILVGVENNGEDLFGFAVPGSARPARFRMGAEQPHQMPGTNGTKHRLFLRNADNGSYVRLSVCKDKFVLNYFSTSLAQWNWFCLHASDPQRVHAP